MQKYDPDQSERRCAAGPDCAEYNWARHLAPLLADPTTPLCPDCLRCAERDTRSLVYDYIDLEQMLPRPVGTALDTQTTFGGSRELPAPLRTSVDELQRTIWWVTTCWAEALGDRLELADPPWTGRTTLKEPKRRVRDGYAVKWAVDRLTPRLRLLAQLPPTEVANYPHMPGNNTVTRFRNLTFVTLTGVDAILHLQWLHRRARSMLGRTRRTTHLPGSCSGCGTEGLRRDEPRHAHDPCLVYCANCSTRWTYDEYNRLVGLLIEHHRRSPEAAA